MKKIYQIALVAVFVMAPAAGAAVGQRTEKDLAASPQSSDVSVLVENEKGQQTKLSPADLSKIRRLSVKVSDHGKDTVFEGVPLVEVLEAAGVEFGEALRGKRLAAFLLVEAADKYQAVFALPELDPAFTDKLVLLADKRDGQQLSKSEGPFRLVVPDEKRQARWVRQVISLKILRAGAANK